MGIFKNQNEGVFDNEEDNDKFDAFKNTLVIPPLFLHQVYREENDPINTVSQMQKSKLQNEYQTKFCVFIDEKMRKQYYADIERNQKMKLDRKKKNTSNKKDIFYDSDDDNFDAILGKKSKFKGKNPINNAELEIEYETLKNEYDL